MKTKTITLLYLPFYVPSGDNDPRWRVEAVTDSTEFSPAQILKKSEVDALCDADGWKVSIKGSKS